MELRVLGPVTVVGDDGDTIVLRSWHQRALLAALTAHRGRAIGAAELADALWTDALPDDPVGALQSHVSRLRRRLGAAGELIETLPTGYRLTAPAVAVDSARFERLVEGAVDTTCRPGEALDRLEDALAMWHGRAFEGLEDVASIGWEASRLEALRADATERRAECLIEAGRTAEAAAAARRLSEEQPFRERSVAILMRALAADGRHAEALREYQKFRELLDDDLGLLPSPELRALESEILGHERPNRSAGAPSGPVSSRSTGLATSSFRGRDAELAAVTSYLARSRLVTLTGPGGVGKTRLALHVVDAVAAGFLDGFHVCELAGVTTGEQVAGAVAHALGIDETADLSLVDRVLDALQPRHVLLLLDNCEHVRGAVATLVDAMLRSTDQVSVLATSRERLGVEGEIRSAVPPLATWSPTGPGASVELFVDRVQALRPDIDLAAELDTVSDVCRRLEGLPLAIELAAAQCVWRSPTEILADLDDHAGDLADPQRHEARHRSLGAVFDWSYALLGARERSAFDRLAVFAGGWTAPAAHHVARATDDDLRALVERSLVTAATSSTSEGGTRYTMLEPVRQFALPHLGRDRDGTIARLAGWAVEFAQAADVGLRGPEELRWRAALDDELPNLRAAHRWCLDRDRDGAIRLAAALYRYTLFGAPPEMYRWAEEVVERFGADVHPHLATAYASAAVGAWHRGDFARAHALATAGTAADSETPAGTQLAWEALGDVETFLGELDRAVDAFDHLVDLARAASDGFHTAVGLLDRGLTVGYLNRHDLARADWEAAAPMVAAAANPTLSTWFDYVGGEIRLDHAPDEALPYLRRAAADARRIGNRLIIGVAGLSAASCEGRVGDPGKALVQYPDLIDHWRRDGALPFQWTTLRTLVELLGRLGRDADAAVLYGAVASNPTSTPIVGADSERIGVVTEAIRHRLGQARFDDLVTRGAAMSADDAVAFAQSCVSGSPPIRHPDTADRELTAT